jgi:hypothetical protein
MKFVILFLSFTLTGVAQTSESRLIEGMNDLIKQTINWNTISRNDFTPAEKNVIGQLTKDSSNAFCLDFRIDGDYLDDFHLLDLDGDKDLDVIFEGFECAGLSTKTALIYLNKNKRYEKALAAAGRLAAIHPGSDLTLYKYPCCSMIDNTVIHYTIRNDSLVEDAGISFFFSPILKPLSKDYDLMIPKKLNVGNRYRLKAKSGICYVPKDSLEHPVFIKESLAGLVNAETTVTAYASTTDKQGISWLYCKAPKDGVTLKNNKPVDYPLMVWIKQQDCIKTEN